MENIRVALRMRPMNKREIDGGDSYGWKITGGNSISLLPTFQQELIGKKKISQSTKMTFTFDACFSDVDDNMLVYEKVVRPVATSSLEGINGTIFMYGSTGCGKTFTMMGMRELTDGSKNIPKALEDSSDSDASEPDMSAEKSPLKAERATQGILISSLKEIFKEAEEDDRRVFFKCSYIEIYNDNVHDLLQKSKEKLGEPLKIVEDAQKGEFVIHNLTEEAVTNLNEVLDILKQGELNRHFAATAMNHNSSRSHTIFRLHVKTIENKLMGSSSKADLSKKRATRRATMNFDQLMLDIKKLQQNQDSGQIGIQKISIFMLDISGKDSIVTESIINFVDLAGSEKANIHTDDGRQKEGQHINRSLFFLTQVIAMKSDKKSDAHIPYRNSPLTKILKTSLGGNSRTLVILALTPVYSQYENSMSTLRFGMSAKKIENKVSANMTMKGDDEAVKMVIAEYEKKIKDLQDQLSDERQRRVQKEQEVEGLENEKQMILSQLSDGGESMMKNLQLQMELVANGGGQMASQPLLGQQMMLGQSMMLNVEGHYFLKAYRIAKKELSHLKSKLKYFEENAAEVQKRHSETYALLLDVCQKKKSYKSKFETMVLEHGATGSNTANSPKQLDKLLEYMQSIKLDQMSSIEPDLLKSMEIRVLSILDHVKFIKIKQEMGQLRGQDMNSDNVSTAAEISDDDQIMKEFLDSVQPDQIFEEEEVVGKKKKKRKRKILLTHNKDLPMLERDIKNKYPKKDQLVSSEEENISNMLRLNLPECDKKIYPLEDELIELERKHLKVIISKWKEDKAKHHESMQAGQEEEGEQHYIMNDEDMYGSESEYAPPNQEENPIEDDLAFQQPEEVVEKPQPRFIEDLFPTSSIPVSTFGRVRINDIKKQVEQSQAFDPVEQFSPLPGERKSVQIMEEARPMQALKRGSSSHGPLKPILKEPKASVYLQNRQDFEANKDKMFEYNGVFMTLREIDEDKRTIAMSPLIASALDYIYSEALTALNYIDAETTTTKQADPLAMHRGSALVRMSIKSAAPPESIVEVDEDQHQDDGIMNELRRRAEQKVRDFSSDRNQSKSLQPSIGFKNRLKEKYENMSSRESSPDVFADMTPSESYRVPPENYAAYTNINDNQDIKKQLFQPQRSTQAQMTLQILAQSQKLLESIQSGSKQKQQIGLHQQPEQLRSSSQVSKSSIPSQLRVTAVESQNISRNSPERSEPVNPVIQSIYTNLQYFQQSSTSSQKKPQSRKMESAPPQNDPPQFSTPSYLLKPQEDPANIIQYADGYQIPNKYTPPQYKKKMQRF